MPPDMESEAFGPSPSPILAVLALLAYIVLIAAAAPAAGIDLTAPMMIAGHGVGALLVYTMTLVIVARGDPRIWRDRDQFAAYLAAVGDGLGDASDAERDGYLQALAWRNGNSAIAQQAGFVAGIASAIPFVDGSWLLGLLTFFAVGLGVGLAVRKVLFASDGVEMQRRLAKGGKIAAS